MDDGENEVQGYTKERRRPFFGNLLSINNLFFYPTELSIDFNQSGLTILTAILQIMLLNEIIDQYKNNCVNCIKNTDKLVKIQIVSLITIIFIGCNKTIYYCYYIKSFILRNRLILTELVLYFICFI